MILERCMVLIISLLYWYLFQRQLLKNQIKSTNFPFLFNQWLGKMYTIQYQQRLIWYLTFITTVSSYQYHIWLWVYYIKGQVTRRRYSLDYRPWRTIHTPPPTTGTQVTLELPLHILNHRHGIGDHWSLGPSPPRDKSTWLANWRPQSLGHRPKTLKVYPIAQKNWIQAPYNHNHNTLHLWPRSHWKKWL